MPDALAILRSLKRRALRSLTAHIERRVLDRWFKTAPLGGRVLDIGGGASPYASYLLPHTQLFNLDIECNAATNLVADAHRLPFSSGSLDAVICTNVLEHLREPTICLAEITTALRAGGELIVIVPFLFKVHPNPEDHWRFTWQCLERLFAEDYEIIDCAVSGGRFAAIWEILGQVRIFEFIRIINPWLARLPLSHRDYALSYCYRLRKRP